MKHSIIFNHDASDVASAIGASVDEMSEKLAEITKDYMTKDKYIKRSQLAELVADKLTKQEIIFLASGVVFNRLDEIEEDLKKFAMMKEMFSDED
jgi:hypothetical protein